MYKYGIKNTFPVEPISISAYGCLVQNGVILHQDLKLIDLLGKSYYMKFPEIQDYVKLCNFFFQNKYTLNLLTFKKKNNYSWGNYLKIKGKNN